MSLRLPRWEELTPEQSHIINRPLNETYAVVGGPGTGKTILALHRAARLEEEFSDQRIKFLVYNNTLARYLAQAITEVKLDAASVDTYTRWYCQWHREYFKEDAPTIEPMKPDWKRIYSEYFEDPELPILFDNLVLDEAQDFPIELLLILRKLSSNATVFIDAQQAISENSTQQPEIIRAINATGRVYNLTINFRNTREIANVANLFYTGHPSLNPGDPVRMGDKPYILKRSSFGQIINEIVHHAENNCSFAEIS